MKKYLHVCLAAVLLFPISAGVGANNASAAAKVVTYKNCTALNQDYKGGVSISSSTVNKGGKTKYKPFVSKELYNANKKSDHDKDGIACEK